jgi:di/tricarboxylate transporter
MYLTLVILGITIIFFIVGRLRSDLVALLSLLALFLTGTVTLDEALSGFSDTTVIMIAALFVVGEGLSRTGVTAWLGGRMLALAGRRTVRLLIVLMVGTALLSAFISNTGTVATLMPAVTSAAWRIGSVPSKFLMPLAFSANSGGLLTLTGTPPNIIINDTLIGAGYEGFGYFEFALIGLPLLVAAIPYMLFFGQRLLPEHKSGERPADLVETISELAQEYTLEGNLFWLRVRYGSQLVGRSLAESGLGRDYGVSVLRIERLESGINGSATGVRQPTSIVRQQIGRLQPEQNDPVPSADTIIQAKDVMLVSGSTNDIDHIMVRYNLGIQRADSEYPLLSEMLLSHEIGVAEVLLTPRSAYIGRRINDGNFAQKYNVRVLKIRRQDKQLERIDEPLKFGDALLVRGRWQDIELISNEARNFVIVGSPEEMSRQVVELNNQAVIATLSLVGMVILMVSGLVPTVIAASMAAMVMVLGGCLSMGQAYRAISWGSVVLIAALIPMSTALKTTGGAEFLANGLVNSLGNVGPLALMGGIFLLTTAFSQVISNSAATILVAPIVLQAATDLSVSPYPLLMIVAVSASAAFLTPIGSTTNLMVATPGEYNFNDFVRVGLPLVLIFLVISLILVPLIWPF